MPHEFEDSLTYKLHKLVMMLDRRAEQVLTEHFDISFSQFAILMHLLHANSVSQRDLAAHLKVTPAAVSRQIERLFELGLIDRQFRPDNRRQHELRLTDAGKDKILAAKKLFGREFRAMFEQIPEQQQEQLHRGVNKLMELLEGQVCRNKEVKEAERERRK